MIDSSEPTPPSGLAVGIAADAAVLAVLGRLGAAAPLWHLVVVSCQQGFDLRRDLALVHGRAPLLVHVKLLPQGTDGPLFTGDQLLQVLVPQLLPGPALPGALPAALQLGLQVDLCRFTAAFSRFLHFTSYHLIIIHLGEC